MGLKGKVLLNTHSCNIVRMYKAFNVMLVLTSCICEGFSSIMQILIIERFIPGLSTFPPPFDTTDFSSQP